MDSFFAVFFNRLSSFALYLVIFLMPLFILPFTPEKFELNKYFLFYALILISFLSFMGCSVLRKSFEIRRTPLDIPLLVLWLVFLLSSILSEDSYLSFFGDFNSLNFSFLGLSFFLIFYFLLTQQIVSSTQIIRVISVFLISGFLSSLYFLNQIWGIIDFTNFGLPAFNLFSASNVNYGIFTVLIFGLSLATVALKKKFASIDFLSFLSFLTSLFVLVLIGFKIVWIVAAIFLFLITMFYLTNLKYARSSWVSVSMVLLVGSLLFIFFGEPAFFTKKLPLEISLGSAVSYNIGKESLTSGVKNFLFGSGPSTFAYEYSSFRPESMNLNVMWNARFVYSYSSAMDWLATNGILSTLIFLAVILIFVGIIINTWLRQLLELRRQSGFQEETEYIDFRLSPLIFWLLAAGWLTTLVAFFLVNFGAALWILFWLLLGLSVVGSANAANLILPTTVVSLKTTPQYAPITSFLFILFFSALIVLSVFLGRFYAAEIYYAKIAGAPTDVKIKNLQTAIDLNKHRAQFYLNMADIFLSKAIDFSNQKASALVISEQVALAVNFAKTATDIAPKNAATWEFLAGMYNNARAVAPEAGGWAINSLEKAAALEPNNPNHYLGLGNAKLLEKRYSEAKKDYEKAISLKPDFLIGYLRLALVQEAQNNIIGSVEIMEKGLVYGRNNAEYVFQLGRYYFNRNKKDDAALAELAFKRALSLNPNYSDAMYALAYLYERGGFKMQAADLYKKVYQLNPGLKDLEGKISGLLNAPSLPTAETTSTPTELKKK